MTSIQPHAQLAQLHKRYLAHLPDKIAHLTTLVEVLISQPADPAARQALYHSVHRLAGSGGAMGMQGVSTTAYALLRFLDNQEASKPAGAENQVFTTAAPAASDGCTPSLAPLEDQEAPLDFAQQLRQHSQAICQAAISETGPPAEVPPLVAARQQPGVATAQIALIGDTTDELTDLVIQLDCFGYNAVCLNLTDLFASSTTYATLLVDLDALDDRTQTRQWLEMTALPIIALSARSDMVSRLRAVRMGAESYLTRPIEISTLVESLDRSTVRQPTESPRVLIVDDAAPVAAVHSAMLEAAGIVTQIVTEPLALLTPLSEFQPDLLLMDLYMPTCTGMELAAVVRQQAAYVSVPIVFLSNEPDRAIQLATLGSGGGDDFLTKPVIAEQLVPAIRSRIQRARTLRTHITRDGLTGLLNHAAILARLAHEIERAQRCQTPLAVAMLDVDHFKLVNDTYGHPAGDRVLKSLARVMQQRVRIGDSIGRYGGEEFMVILPGADGHAAKHVVDEVRTRFGQVWHQEGLRRWTTTFSAGVARYPGDTTALVDAADAALYCAKRGGRNQVVYDADMYSDAQQPK